jgi:hypothetical protein
MFCITPELYAALKRTGLGPREVRVGDVRFGSHFGLKSDIAACPKSANNGHVSGLDLLRHSENVLLLRDNKRLCSWPVFLPPR